ncbi:MAG TPA: hypothetical protein VN046_04175, partial [Stenotrophobium sp.]|nr:hypothetical protein [Stenotrophobium sp.]
MFALMSAGFGPRVLRRAPLASVPVWRLPALHRALRRTRRLARQVDQPVVRRGFRNRRVVVPDPFGPPLHEMRGRQRTLMRRCRIGWRRNGRLRVRPGGTGRRSDPLARRVFRP